MYKTHSMAYIDDHNVYLSNMKSALIIVFCLLSFSFNSSAQFVILQSYDTLMVSIYPVRIDDFISYVRVAGGGDDGEPFNNKSGQMQWLGTTFNGWYYEYYPCSENPGELRRFGMLKEGRPDGVFLSFHENGNPAMNELYNNGSIVSLTQCRNSFGVEIEPDQLFFIKPLIKEEYWSTKSESYGESAK